MDKYPVNQQRFMLSQDAPSKFDDATQDGNQSRGAKLPLLYSAQKIERWAEDIAYFFPDKSQNKLESQREEDDSLSSKRYCTNC